MSTSRANEPELRTIELFRPENRDSSDLEGVREFMESSLPSVRVQIRPPLADLVPQQEKDSFAHGLAKARMRDYSCPSRCFEPMFGEIEYEKRVLNGKAKAGGVVYDGHLFCELLRGTLGLGKSLETASIVFTDRLVSTYSRDDLRYHLRTLVCGFPSVISIPGVVEAPARSREYYIVKRHLELVQADGAMIESAKRAFRDEFIDYGDKRIETVLQSLSLQAVFYHLVLDPFCDSPTCRLYNAHWQSELVTAHISSASLCPRHEAMLQQFAKEPRLSWRSA